jgi:hypothetical protein
VLKKRAMLLRPFVVVIVVALVPATVGGLSAESYGMGSMRSLAFRATLSPAVMARYAVLHSSVLVAPEIGGALVGVNASGAGTVLWRITPPQSAVGHGPISF